MVAVESESMVPHLKVGDLIFIESANRTEIVTYEESKKTGVSSFESYGNVILYKRKGSEKLPPIIHRVMFYVDKDDPMWPGGPPVPYAACQERMGNRSCQVQADTSVRMRYSHYERKSCMF